MSEQAPLVSPQADVLRLMRAAHIPVFYCSPETNVKVVTMNSNASLTTVRLSARVMHFSGEIYDDQIDLPITTSDRSKETNTITQLRNKFIVSAQLDPVEVNRYGQTYAQVIIANSKRDIDVCMLLAGYIESVHSLATGLMSKSNEKQLDPTQGYLRVVLGTNPAANVEVDEAVPTNARWWLLSFKVTLVTDANVANRVSKLTILDEADFRLYRSFNSTQVTASSTCELWWTAYGQHFQDGVIDQCAGIPEHVPLKQGYQITTETKNMQAGDNYGQPTYYVKEKIEE